MGVNKRQFIRRAQKIISKMVSDSAMREQSFWIVKKGDPDIERKGLTIRLNNGKD